MTLPAGKWRDVLSDLEYDAERPVALGDLLGRLPVALLVRA
jgi:maltooligosyltrehalose synthase